MKNVHLSRSVRFEGRFWARVVKTDGCWIWCGVRSSRGYGVVRREGRRYVGAHRVSWELANGPIPDGMIICHECDIPLCVRPDHLFLGTSQENAADMVGKGRQASGERNSHAKLSANDVAEIRRLHAGGGTSYRKLASRFGVNKSQIGYIVRGRCWR